MLNAATPTGAPAQAPTGLRMTLNSTQAAALAQLCDRYGEMDVAPVCEVGQWRLLAWWTECPEEGALDLGAVGVAR